MHAFVRFTRKRERAAALFRARMLPAYLCKRVWSFAKTHAPNSDFQIKKRSQKRGLKTVPILALGLPPRIVDMRYSRCT